jgi:hypothetical protein
LFTEPVPDDVQAPPHPKITTSAGKPRVTVLLPATAVSRPARTAVKPPKRMQVIWKALAGAVSQLIRTPSVMLALQLAEPMTVFAVGLKMAMQRPFVPVPSTPAAAARLLCVVVALPLSARFVVTDWFFAESRKPKEARACVVFVSSAVVPETMKMAAEKVPSPVDVKSCVPIAVGVTVRMMANLSAT